MPLLNIADKDIRIAFELLEGKDMAYNLKGLYSLDFAIDYFNKHSDKKHKGFSIWSTLVIYGMGGLNRYYVNEDGSIRFSTFHMGYKDITKDVEALGFIID